MSERTARTYEQAGALPSALKRPHDLANPLEPFRGRLALGGRATRTRSSSASQRRCLPCCVNDILIAIVRRRIARCGDILPGGERCHGPEKEIIFEQLHTPGERAQSDFTHMEDLGVTIAGEPFPHMVYHFVLTYSNVEAASICFSETFEALAEGIEKALWQLGGVPQQHRTDHLSAAVRHCAKRKEKTGLFDTRR